MLQGLGAEGLGFAGLGLGKPGTSGGENVASTVGFWGSGLCGYVAIAVGDCLSMHLDVCFSVTLCVYF